MNPRRLNVLQITAAKTSAKNVVETDGRATNASPIEKVHVASSAGHRPARNGLISRVGMIKDRPAIAIDPIARADQTCSVANVVKMDAIIVRQLKDRCRRSE